MPLLSSCGSQKFREIPPLAPPSAYLTPCPQSTFEGETFGEAVDFLIKVMEERDLCASQINAIREWQTQMQSERK